MKKLLTVMLILVMLLTLFACTEQATGGASLVVDPASSGAESESDPDVPGESESGEGTSEEELVSDPTGEGSSEGIVLPTDDIGSLPYSHKDSIGGGAYGGLVDGGGAYGGIVSDLSPRTPGGIGELISGGDTTGDPTGGKSNETVKAGQITAKARNDNDNYEEWVALFADKTDNDEAGKFSVYKEGVWAFDTTMRVTVRVTHGGEPVCGAYLQY